MLHPLPLPLSSCLGCIPPLIGLPSLRFYAVGSSLFLLSVCFCLCSLFYRDDVLCWLLLARPFLYAFHAHLRFPVDLVWFRLSCDHGWIRSGSVNVRKQQKTTTTTCRRSRSVLRGCGAESLSEPEKVVRLAFPRPLEGSSRRRWPVGAEPSLAEKDSVRLARAISQSRRVSRSQRSPGRVLQAASRRSRRRSVAFTTSSLRGVLTLVARARARSNRHRLPVRSNMVSWTSVAWSLMGTRSSEGNALFLNMNLDTGRSR